VRPSVGCPATGCFRTPRRASANLVRRVRSEGPQHATVYGRDEVVVVSAEEFRRLKGERSGDALIAAMQASPYRDIDIEPKRDWMPVRGTDL
jgi:prevent-host-death family protein